MANITNALGNILLKMEYTRNTSVQTSDRDVSRKWKLPTAEKIAEARKYIDAYQPLFEDSRTQALSRHYLDSVDEGVRILGIRTKPAQTQAPVQTQAQQGVSP